MTIELDESIPLRDQAADILRQQILDGELQPGFQLSERQLSKEFLISTTPIKEALRILQSEGLIITKPRRGSFVSHVSKNQLLTLTYMRSSLEGIAAHWAAVYITDKELEAMEDALNYSWELIESNADVDLLKNSNSRFHAILRNACRHQYLLNMMANMRSMDITIRSRSLTLNEEEPRRAHKEHLEILEAVRNRDSHEAERITVEHIRRVALMTLSEEST